jgi:hypothetical protein
MWLPMCAASTPRSPPALSCHWAYACATSTSNTCVRPSGTNALRAKVPPRKPNQNELEALPLSQRTTVVEAIRDALDGRALTREELGEEIERRVGTWVTKPMFPAFGGQWPGGQLGLGQAALEGVVVFGPIRGRESPMFGSTSGSASCRGSTDRQPCVRCAAAICRPMVRRRMSSSAAGFRRLRERRSS